MTADGYDFRHYDYKHNGVSHRDDVKSLFIQNSMDGNRDDLWKECLSGSVCQVLSEGRLIWLTFAGSGSLLKYELIHHIQIISDISEGRRTT